MDKPELVPGLPDTRGRDSKSMLNAFDSSIRKSHGGVDSALQETEHQSTVHALRKASRDAYFRESLPGGSVHKSYEDKIARHQQKFDALYALQDAAPEVLRSVAGSYGIEGESDEDLRGGLKRSIAAAKAHVTRQHKDLASLRQMAEDYHAGVPLVIPDVEKARAPDVRKTAAKADVHTRYHRGEVAMDEIATNPDFKMNAKQDTGKGAMEKFVGAPDWIGNDPQKLNKLFDDMIGQVEHGRNAKHWYEYSSSMIRQMARGDLHVADKLAQLLAIYSAHTNLDDNMQGMKRAWDTYTEATRKGEYIPIRGGVTDNQDKLAEKILYGGATWDGRKTNNFYVNLMSSIDPSLRQGVTVDVWAKRPFNYHLNPDGSEGKEVDAPSDAQYGFMENFYHQLAHEMTRRTGEKWEPQQVQAAIWTSQRIGSDSKGIGVAEKNRDKALARLSKASKDAPRFAKILEPGEFDRRTQSAAEEFYGTLKALGDHNDQALASGAITPDTHAMVKQHLSSAGSGYDPDQDPGAPLSVGNLSSHPDQVAAQVDHARKLYEKKTADHFSEFDKARKWENAKDEATSEDQRAERLRGEVANPSDYNFLDATLKTMSGQMNMEMIPGEGSGWDMDGLHHAPFHVKDKFSRELYPVAQEVLGKLGVLRGPQGDLRGFGDWGDSINPMYALGLSLPRQPRGLVENPGGIITDPEALVPNTRVDSTAPTIHEQTEKQTRLAAATLAYIMRQHGVAYMNMKPLEAHKDTGFRTTDPEMMKRYGVTAPKKIGLDATIKDTGDQRDKANIAHYSFKSGKMTMDAWSKILEAKKAAADKYGFDPGMMPIVPTADGNGFAALNLTTHPYHEGTAYSNREFQKISDEIVNSVEDERSEWDLSKRLFGNGGGMDYESWQDEDGAPAGENLRRIIRDLGGDSAVDYADHVFENKVRPVFERWKDWRQHYGDQPDPEPTRGFERITASEAVGGNRRGGASQQAGRARDRRLSLTRSDVDEGRLYLRRLKARRILLKEPVTKALSQDDQRIVRTLRTLL